MDFYVTDCFLRNFDAIALEAEALCKWRTEESKGKHAYRLPTEIEWEKAARGENGIKYPWGNEFDTERCNVRESKIGKTTPVTRYSNGVSPYGCYDMVGNVWEWTDSWYDNNKDTKVLRGGSWNGNQVNARCAYRSSVGPTYREIVVGFRCVRT